MLDEEQEKLVDDALKNVKASAFHIHNTIERNQMRACLRQTSAMLMELKTNILTPKSYYNLYSVIFDEMQYVYNFFKEEARRGRRMKDLYNTVQEASNIIPRLYLMVTAGAVYIESIPSASKEIVFDLLGMVKGVQSPTRGLFTRYYLLKMVKDKVPDKGNDYEREDATINDTVSFILQNLEEMNRLWIRLSTGTVGSEKTIRENERNELRILVGENIVRLSSLDGLSLELYQGEILPRIINIMIDSKDRLAQQYLMECLIHAFPDEYNIQCISTILDTFTKLQEDVDVISLLIAMMDKLSKYLKEYGKEKEDIMASTEKIFDSLKESIDIKTEMGISAGVTDPLKLIELQYVFMKFSIVSCPQKSKLDTINHILHNTMSVLTAYNKRLGQDGVQLLRNLLSVPLESELSLFDLQKLPELMVYLDFNCRTTLAIRIIQSLSNKEKLDSTEKVNILLGFIRPLLEDSADTIEMDEVQFEYDQNVVSKMLFVISTNDPVKLLDILIAIIPVFSKGGVRRIKYTLPTLANAFINLAYQVCSSYVAKCGGDEDNKTGIHNDYINNLDLTAFDNNDFYEKFLGDIHTRLSQIIAFLTESFPELSFKLYLSAALQANSIKISGDKFSENLRGYISSALSIYQQSELDPAKKVSLLVNLIGTLLHVRNLSNDVLADFINKIQELCLALPRRFEQCCAMLSCSELHFTLLRDVSKATECLKKAKRYAEFAMTNPDNLKLFMMIVNKYLFYVETCKDDECFILTEDFEDTLDIIKCYIETIKNENKEQSFLPECERFFKDTLDIIKARKDAKKYKFYEDLNL